MSFDLEGLGLPERYDLKARLARDVLLQLAGMESLANLHPVDLARLANDVASKRNSQVLSALEDASALADLSAKGESITIAAIEERIPHASVLFIFYTTAVLAATWKLFEKESQRSSNGNAEKQEG